MSSKARAFQQACRLRNQARARDDKAQAARLPTSTASSPIHFLTLTSRGRPSHKPTTLIYSFDSSRRLRLSPQMQCRRASTNSGPSRRAITVTSDDGRYNWSDLSTGEKAARGTQQTFNFLLVCAGLIGTVRRKTSQTVYITHRREH